GVHMGADEDAGGGDQQQVLGAVHHLDAHHRPGLLGDGVVLDAQTAPVGDAVLLHRGALAVAVFRNGQHRLAGGGPGGAHHVVSVSQLDAPHTVGVPAHDTHVVLVKAHGQPKVGGNEDLLGAVGLADLYQLVVLVHLNGPDAVVPNIFQRGEGDALHGALP